MCRVSEQSLKCICALPYHTERILQRLTEVIQLLNNPTHCQGIREEQQLPRTLYVPVLDDVELPDRFHLDARYKVKLTPSCHEKQEKQHARDAISRLPLEAGTEAAVISI